MVYTHNGMISILKNEGNPVICYHLDKPWGYYAKLKQKTNTVWLYIYEVPRVVKIRERKQNSDCYQGLGIGEGDIVVQCVQFQFC